MQYDDRKSFPHPVLAEYNNDYDGVAFQASARLNKAGPHLEFEVQYTLSDPSLLDLIEHGQAAYVSVVKCPTTYYRQAFVTQGTEYKHQFEQGELQSQVDICPFIVSKVRIEDFRSPYFNEEYGDMAFDIQPGTVIAVNEPKVYYCDLPELRFGSIFELVVVPTISEGMFNVSLEGPKIAVQISKNQKARIDVGLQDPQTQEFVLMSVFLPTLMHVLSAVKANADEYIESKWYRALLLKLESMGKEIQDIPDDCLPLAQELFGNPLGRLPLPNPE
jgi:hypothetical protein